MDRITHTHCKKRLKIYSAEEAWVEAKWKECLSAEAYTTALLIIVTLNLPLLRCPRKIFRHANKNTLSLVMVYLALFNNIFKALNLFLNRYLAEIQLPDNGISHLAALRTTEVRHRVLQ